MDKETAAYFEKLNPITRKIVHETKVVQTLFNDKWDTFEEKKKDDILDDYFVPPDVRDKYQRLEQTDHYPMSYPVLKVQMGEKIVVDEANDFWTWQDEFSGPFSWKTKSQQDLTLMDLEPEQMTKQSKTRRRSSKDLTEETSKTAPQEFLPKDPGTSLWNTEFKNLHNVKLPPKPEVETSSMSSQVQQPSKNFKRENSPEEINYAFNRDSYIDSYLNDSKNDKSRESSNKTIQEIGSSTANGYKKKKPEIEMSVFENPMISHVIDDEDSSSSATTSPSHRPLLKNHGASNLSPSRKPLLKGDSFESSNSGKSLLNEPEKQMIDFTDRAGQGSDDKSQLVSNVEYEDTELIAVDVQSGTVVDDSSRASMTSFDLPKTGFDFLDAW